MEEKKTLGQQYIENVINKVTEVNEVTDVQRTLTAKYIERLRESVDNFRKNYHDDFFVEVLMKGERLFGNMPRTYFIPRKSCPTPGYDQSVYKYNAYDDTLEYLWTVPDMDSANYMASHCLEIPEAEKQLFKFVMDYYDGTLLKRCKEYNNEQAGSNLLKGKEIVTDREAREIKKFIEKAI